MSLLGESLFEGVCFLKQNKRIGQMAFSDFRHRLALYSLPMLGNVCMGALPGGGQGAAITAGLVTMVAGIVSDLAAADLAQGLNRRPEGRKLLENEHLTKAVGRAIAAVIDQAAEEERYRPVRDRVKAMSLTVLESWKEIHIRHEEDLLGVSGYELPRLFSGAASDFAMVKTLSLVAWERLIRYEKWWSRRERRFFSGGELGEAFVKMLAQDLYDGFALALFDSLADDAARDGEAFAKLTMLMMGELLCLGTETKTVASKVLELAEDQRLISQMVRADVQGMMARQNELMMRLDDLQRMVIGTLTEDQVEAGVEAYLAWIRPTLLSPSISRLAAKLDPRLTVLDLPEPSCLLAFKQAKDLKLLTYDPEREDEGDSILKADLGLDPADLPLDVGDIIELIHKRRLKDFRITAPGLLVVGEAGLGKSSYLRRIAVEWVDAGRMPVLVKWPEWERSGQSLAAYLEDGSWLANKPTEAVSPLKANDRSVLVLLDGFDELLERDRALRELQAFVSGRGRGYFVVISMRPLDTQSLEGAFIKLMMDRIPEPGAREFLERFGAAPTMIPEAASINLSVNPLVRNGLMLTLYAIYSEGRKERAMVKNPVEVVEHLLASPIHSPFFEHVQRAERSRQIPHEARVRILELIALHATLSPQGRSYVFNKEWVYRCVLHVCQEWRDRKYINPEDAVFDLFDGCGFLEDTLEGVRFFHASFQDYFASRCWIMLHDEFEDGILEGWRDYFQVPPDRTDWFQSPVVPGVRLIDSNSALFNRTAPEVFTWRIHQRLYGLTKRCHRIFKEFVQNWSRDYSKLDLRYRIGVLSMVKEISRSELLPIAVAAVNCIHEDLSQPDSLNMLAEIVAGYLTGEVLTQEALAMLDRMPTSTTPLIVASIVNRFHQAHGSKECSETKRLAFLQAWREDTERLAGARQQRLMELLAGIEHAFEGGSGVRFSVWLEALQNLTSGVPDELFVTIAARGAVFWRLREAEETLLNYVESACLRLLQNDDSEVRILDSASLLAACDFWRKQSNINDSRLDEGSRFIFKLASDLPARSPLLREVIAEVAHWSPELAEKALTEARSQLSEKLQEDKLAVLVELHGTLIAHESFAWMMI